MFGWTTTRASRQSKNLDSEAIVARMAAVERLGFTLRSRNRASCLQRNRFSAMTAAWEEQPDHGGQFQILPELAGSSNRQAEFGI